jgi:hypothetical protein
MFMLIELQNFFYYNIKHTLNIILSYFKFFIILKMFKPKLWFRSSKAYNKNKDNIGHVKNYVLRKFY